jgi:hypothetical protein
MELKTIILLHHANRHGLPVHICVMFKLHAIPGSALL